MGHDGAARCGYSPLVIRNIEQDGQCSPNRLALAIALLAGLSAARAGIRAAIPAAPGGRGCELNRIVAEFDAEAQRENLKPAEGRAGSKRTPIPWPANAAKLWRRRSIAPTSLRSNFRR